MNSQMNSWQRVHDAVFAEDDVRDFDAFALACVVHAAVWCMFAWFMLSVAQSFAYAIQ